MATLEEVQLAYQDMLQKATQQFEQQVQAATVSMQQMIKEAAKESTTQAVPEPIAEARDGGLWMNKEAVEMLLQALEKIGSIIDEIQKSDKQQ